MAAECEARRDLAGATWHLDRMARETKDLIATYMGRARISRELGRSEKRPDDRNLSLAFEDYGKILDAGTR